MKHGSVFLLWPKDEQPMRHGGDLLHSQYPHEVWAAFDPGYLSACITWNTQLLFDYIDYTSEPFKHSIIYFVVFCKLTYQQFQFSKLLEISNFSLISLITLLKLTNKLLGSNIFESKWRNLKNSLVFWFHKVLCYIFQTGVLAIRVF